MHRIISRLRRTDAESKNVNSRTGQPSCSSATYATSIALHILLPSRGCILRSCQTAQEVHQEEEEEAEHHQGEVAAEELVVEEEQEALAVEQDVLRLATNKEEDRGNKEELAASKRRRRRRSSWTWQSLWTRRSGSNFKVVEKVSDCGVGGVERQAFLWYRVS